MPKIIAPRRTNKQVSAEEFWAIRQKFSHKKQKPIASYQQTQVENRHRFVKLRDQIKVFNPLEYFITKEQDYSSQSKTHTHAYLQSISYRLPQEIMQVKRHMFGLASILKNMKKILTLLWDHLQSEDSWRLLQSLLRDTREESYNLWLQIGLWKIIENIGLQFKQLKFKQIFHTICVLMDVCFEKITQSQNSLYQFLEIIVRNYFQNSNKYIRKFSTKMISYILSNISEQLFQKFIVYTLSKEKTNEIENNLVSKYLPDIFSQRLKYSVGCLTPNSVQQLVDIVTLSDSMSIDAQIMRSFVHKVLNNLQDKKQREETETLFDINYIIKAFVHLSNQNKISKQSVLQGVSYYLKQEVNQRQFKKRYLNVKSLQMVSQLLWENLNQLPQSSHIYFLLGQSFQLQISNIGNVKKFLQESVDQNLIYEFLEIIDESLSETKVTLIIAGFKHQINRFFTEKVEDISDTNILIIYKLFLLSKNSKVHFKLQKFLGPEFNFPTFLTILVSFIKQRSITDEKIYRYLLVLLRMLSVVELPSPTHSILSQLMKIALYPYYSTLNYYISKGEENKSIFCCSNYTKEIFLYSHYSIPFVWQGFNLIQSFVEIQRSHRTSNLQFIIRDQDYQFWQTIAINRPSMSSQIKYFLRGTGNTNYLIALQSRHRVVRYFTVKHIRQNKFFSEIDSILQMMEKIEEQNINLDNERNVKRLFLEMLRFIQKQQLTLDQNNMLICWCIGISFTGFKLIQESLSNFISTLIQTQSAVNFNILIRFLQFYTFRNSRIYPQQTRKFYSNNQTVGFCKSLQLPQAFSQLVKKDFVNNELQTAEYIGVDRITSAISKSQKVKKKLGNQLNELLHQYFSEEFVRFKKSLSTSQVSYLLPDGNPNPSMLPPKTTFLCQILKIVPNNYEPPIECLHFTPNYLKIDSISKIKRQSWELMWSKQTKMQHSRVIFDSMSLKQMQLYIHFLWGQVLKADSNRLRIIIQYIRDYMNHKVEYFVNIYFSQLLLGAEQQEKIKKIFEKMDSRKLLTFIYILKAIIKTLKNYIRQNYAKVLTILRLMIEVVQIPVSKLNPKALEHDMEIEENLNEEEDIDENEQLQLDQAEVEDNAGQFNDGTSRSKKFKNHRKQIYKILVLTVSVLGENLSSTEIDQILQVIDRQGRILLLAKNSERYTPGLLLFFQQLSKFSSFHSLFVKYKIFEQFNKIIQNSLNPSSTTAVLNIIALMLGVQSYLNREQQQMTDANEGEYIINQKIAQELLCSIISWVSSVNKIKTQTQSILLPIILKLFQKSQSISIQWERFLLQSISKILGSKTLSDQNARKLWIIIQISMQYASKEQKQSFLVSLLPFIPQLKDIKHRQLIISSVTNSPNFHIGDDFNIRQQALSIIKSLNSTIDGGLVVELDYTAFFDGVSLYKQISPLLSIFEQEFIIYNLLAYIGFAQLSVRKAVNSCIQTFLDNSDIERKKFITKLFRIISEELRKPYNSQDQIFWSVFSILGIFIRWIVLKDFQNSEHYSLFEKFIGIGNDNNLFQMLSSISQSRKLDGLKIFREILKKQWTPITASNYPSLIVTIFVPVLEHFILPPTTNNSNYRFDMAGNLTSSLAHVSLELYEQAMRKGGESLQKRYLKKMISKLRFDDHQTKKNIVLTKIISQIVESIELPKVTETIHTIILEQGFDQFHQKMVQKQSKVSKIQEDDDSQSEDQIRKKIAFNGLNNDIEDDELINMQYMALDKKLLQFQDPDLENTEQSNIIKFLRLHVLVPLKTMLMHENRSSKDGKEQNQKSRMFLSTAITKIILKFPIDVFVSQLQRILSKLGKLLKKRQIEIRENSRKCLAEIAKLIGPDMFYLIFKQLKFHLRDNFQNHILNYTIYYILEKYGQLETGSIDHCLPLLLPSIIDQIFGKQATEKEMVDENKIPTLNMESKKRKSNQLISIVCKQISVKKIDYLVKYFEKFLLQFMNTEANVARYEQMLTNIVGGLSKNQEAMSISHSNLYIDIVYQSIQKLKSQIKLYKFQDTSAKHESTVKQQHFLIKKVGKQTLQLQQEAGRNASIFKKRAKQIRDRRNQEILIGCFLQFHLSLLALLIKKKIINSEQYSQKFQSIITFIVQCIEHRDNRLVHKCLKVIHNVIHWKKLPNIAQIRKKTSRKIFPLIQKLTSSDEDLLKQCFTLLNDLFEQIKITEEVLHILITIIKVNVTTADQVVVQEPYKLLKTVLIKISNDHSLLFSQSVYQLYQYIRLTLISTTLDHIRSICRQICCIFMKQQSTILVESKKKQRPLVDFGKEISFYLNNLDCKYSQTQQSLLDVIKTYVIFHSKQELQETGEVIIMSIGTNYANDPENSAKMSEIIKLVLQKIDNSKVLSLVDKCLLWSSNQTNQLISVCGFFIMVGIVTIKIALLNNERKSSILRLCEQILSKQLSMLEDYNQSVKQKFHQTLTVKNNPDWQNIIEVSDPHLSIQKNFKPVTQILNIMIEQTKADITKIIQILWRLFPAPSKLLHCQSGALLIKSSSISRFIGEKIVSLNAADEESLKSTVLTLVKNANQTQTMEYACRIVAKVLEQVEADQNIQTIFESITSTLQGRISKSILNLKKNYHGMLLSFQILIHVLGLKKERTQKLVSNQKTLGQIMWNICKVNRNELIEIEIKSKNEQLSEIVKGIIGESEFYRYLANVEADRKQKKASQKAEMLKLAITDQEAYGQAKLKKKHKKF